MSNWADAKKAARQVVHDTFSLPGIFYATGTSTPTVGSDSLCVRVHDKDERVGDLAGTNLSYAETVERPTRMIFQTTELEGRNIARGSMVTMCDYMGVAVGYYIDVVHPADGLTTTCEVTPLSAAELSGKLLPDGTRVP